MKKHILMIAALLCLILAGCSQPAPSQEGEPVQDPSVTVSAPPVETPTEALSPAEVSAEPTAPAVGQAAMVYIGTKAGGFTDYPIVYDGELTPEKLIQGIADLTGWDLTLEDEITSGKGGMSVCLSSESALFTGPPDPQKEEFHMYDVGQLAETILDSIQKTLQMGFTGEGGDPDTLDIWYCMEDGQPLEIPALGISWTTDQPYQWMARISEEPPET